MSPELLLSFIAAIVGAMGGVGGFAAWRKAKAEAQKARAETLKLEAEAATIARKADVDALTLIVKNVQEENKRLRLRVEELEKENERLRQRIEELEKENQDLQQRGLTGELGRATT